MKKDTIAAKALAKKATANTFAFRVATDGYYVESQKDTTYLATVNGVLTTVEELKDALAFEVTKSTTTPSSNEGVSVATVKVVAGQGVVTISGAAGKKVTISNILGQTATVQILSSDNATIAAPAGVVVVAVEGEEAVKAIVK